MQSRLAPVTLDHLRSFGVPDETELRMEFFFYSKTMIKAEELASELRLLNYDVETGKSAGANNLFLITGWTIKMKMDNETVVHWAEEMCELGYEFDCKFDGWGTTPNQE